MQLKIIVHKILSHSTQERQIQRMDKLEKTFKRICRLMTKNKIATALHKEELKNYLRKANSDKLQRKQ